MKKRLLLAAFCVLAVPLMFASFENGKLTSSAPFAPVALAGHTNAGDWCDCHITPGCICDPGEQSARPAPSNPSSGSKRIKGSAPDLDLASGVFALALVLLLMRMR
ncbi:MAG TPA: hypothetical protein VGL29_13970 [Blastocatellia bacterium]